MSPDGPTSPPPPEEKLLKLIRNGPRQAPAPQSARADAAGSAGRARGPIRLPALKIEWVTCAVVGFIVVLVVEAVALLLVMATPSPTQPLPAASRPSADAPSGDPAAPSFVQTPAQEVPSLAQSASSALFAVLGDSGQSPAAARARPSDSGKLLASRLTLMGVVSGDPAQAIIEDSKTQKTYFVMPGQAVVEGAVLERVLDNRVVLDLDGEKIELTL